MSVMSLRLPDEIADTLANLAKATGRSKSYLAVDGFASISRAKPGKSKRSSKR